MSKTACGSCSTSAAEPSANAQAWWLALGLGAAVSLALPGVRATLSRAAAVALVALVAIVLRRPAVRSSTPLWLWLMAAGWAMAGLGLVPHAIVWAPMPLICVVVVNVAAGGLDPQLVAERFALVSGATGAGIAVWQLAAGRAVHGGAGNANWLGIGLAVCLPLVIAMTARLDSPSWQRWAARAVAAAMLIVIALSQARGAWLGLGVAGMLVIVSRWRRLTRRIGLVAVAAALALAAWQTDALRALEGRLWIWRCSWHALGDAPYSGVGAGRFGFAFLDAQGAQLASRPLDDAAVQFLNATHAHNDALQLLLEYGVIAGCLPLVAVGVAAWQLRRRWSTGGVALVVAAISGLLDVALLQPPVLVVVGLSFAACPAARSVDRRNGWLPAVAGAAVAGCLTVVVPQVVAEHRAERAKDALPAERLRVLSALSDTAPDPGRFLFEVGLLRAARGDLAGATTAFERSLHTFANVGTNIALGNARLQAGDTAAAITRYQRALAHHPARFAAHANLTRAAHVAGDFTLAQRHLDAARELQPHHPKLRSMQEAQRVGRIEQATR